MMGQPRRRLQPPWASLALLLWCTSLPLASAKVTIPPLLEDQPPKGEVLFKVNHDPDQDPEPFTLPCRADALPAASYSWLKDGEPFDPNDVDDDQDGDRVEMVEGEGTLVFHNPRVGDEGDYRCIAENSVGTVHSEVASVRRAVLGNFPKTDPKVVTARLGQSLSLPCTPPEGYPSPSLHWILQNTDGGLLSLNSPRLTVDEEGTLWFSYVTPEDASEDALYACAASSATSWQQMFMVYDEEGVPEMFGEPPSDGPVTSMNMPTEYRMGNWVYLNVSYPDDDDEVTLPESPIAPVVQHVSPREITTLAGEDVKLRCIYGGYPVPEVKWWRESRADVENDQLEHFGKVLVLRDVTEEDMGSYYCQATNEAGEGETHQFTVYIEAAPHFVVEPEVVNLPEGESATFNCEARGDPAPTITWTKDGETMESHDTTIVFDTLSLDHKAVIACNASNAHGYAYKSVYLNVLSLPPEWMTEPEDVAVLESSSATLECEAFGSPDPEVTWARIDGEEKVEIHDEDPRYDIQDNKLVIKSVQENSDGPYVCIATNKFATIESVAEVAIRSHTEAEVSVIHDRVEAGDHVSLDCRVVIDEALEPKVTWLHDDVEIDLDDDNYHLGRRESNGDDDDEGDNREVVTWVLEIMQVHGDDSGVYTCHVKTDLDRVKADLILNVEDVPNPPNLKNVECGGREAYLEWASTGDNNAPLQGYVIQYVTQFHPDEWKDAENQIPSSETSYSVEMSPGLNYTFRVLAFNRVGMSDPSDDLEKCSSPGLPPDHHPYNVTIVANAPGSLQVSWDVMEHEEHNGPDFHYKVLWRPLHDDPEEDDQDEVNTTLVEIETPTEVEEDFDDDTEGDWHTMYIEDWEQNEVELDDLPAYKEYLVKVEAYNSYGTSEEPVQVLQEHSGQDVPEEAPSVVEAIDADATDVVLTWEPVDEDSVHGLLLGYKIEVWEADQSDSDAEEVLTTGPATRVELTDLKPYTEYQARVRAVNSAYSGPASSQISFTTAEGESGPVSDFDVQQLGSNSLLVNWDAPEDPNGVIQGYTVQYRKIDPDGVEGPIHEYTAEELKPENTMVKLPNLEEEGSYRVTVTAVNSAGNGEESSVEIEMQTIKSVVPAVPVFTWALVQDDSDDGVTDADNDGDIDEDDRAIADVDDDGDVDSDDLKAADQDEKILLADTDGDGDIDSEDVLDIDGDGDIDEADISAADVDDDGDVDIDDVKQGDRDGDSDIDAADVGDLNGDGVIDERDLDVKDRDGDGIIDKRDYELRNVFLGDTDRDGDIDVDDVLDTDGDGDIDEKDIAVADIDNDGDIDVNDIRVADRDHDGDVDIADIGDEDGDGDIDGADVLAADRDGDGDIDARDDNGKHIILSDSDGDGIIDKNDVTDITGDGIIDQDDLDAADVDNDGDVDADDIRAADRDGDGDIDAADITDVNSDGIVDGRDLIASDKDGDGKIELSDIHNLDVFLKDTNRDGKIDVTDVLDTDFDGDIDQEDIDVADIDNDGDVDMDDIIAADMDGDGDVDFRDIGDQDGDGDIDGDDLEAADTDGDGDVDAADEGHGVDIQVNWRPDFESHPGVDFYVENRVEGADRWHKSDVEKEHLHQTLRGLDPRRAYEVRMVAIDGPHETPSDIILIPASEEMDRPEDPTVGAVMEETNPILWTWFIIAVMVAVTMICVVFFSMWVYSHRIARVAELRAALYEGYEPAKPEPVKDKLPDKDIEAAKADEVEDEMSANYQRKQLAAMMKRQETIQSVDSFASHDDDFAEYGDESMAIDLLSSVSLVTNPRHQRPPPAPRT